MNPFARLAAALGLAAVGCAGSPPGAHRSEAGSRLVPCPATPNCVSSEAADAEHRVDAYALDERVEPAVAWAGVREAVAALPRTRIVDEAPGYLRAECRSWLFRFVDDLELELRARERRIAVRSASRVGRSDLGVNRRRVDALRGALRERALAR